MKPPHPTHRPDRRDPAVDFTHLSTIRQADPDGLVLLAFTTTARTGWVVSSTRVEHGTLIMVAVRPGPGNHPRTPPEGFPAAPRHETP